MLKRLVNKKNEGGFTLIELMIVIAIIGILAAIAIPNFISYRTRGADSAAKTEATNFLSACLAYVADTGVAKSCSPAVPFPGFTHNPKITAVSGPTAVALTGAITGTSTFTHTSGSTTYSVNPDGTVTP